MREMADPDAEISTAECDGFVTALQLGTVDPRQLDAAASFVLVAMNAVRRTAQKTLPHRRLR